MNTVIATGIYLDRKSTVYAQLVGEKVYAFLQVEGKKPYHNPMVEHDIEREMEECRPVAGGTFPVGRYSIDNLYNVVRFHLFDTPYGVEISCDTPLTPIPFDPDDPDKVY